MGVYIPDLEIPTSCFDCPVSHPALGNLGAAILGCPLIGKTLSAPFCEEKRMDTCPLVPVPSHGRLINADALSQMFDPDESFGAAVLEIIVDTPTIIPAEEDET